MNALPMNSALGPAPRSLAGLLTSLFACLEREGVKYCVMHEWAGVAYGSNEDGNLCVAIHPRDAHKLTAVVRAIDDLGYRPIQVVNYELNAFVYIFAWFEREHLRTGMVDFAFEHRERSLLWMTGEAMVTGRRQSGACWAAHPSVEFRRVLVNRVARGQVGKGPSARLRNLIGELGEAQAEEIAAELLGRKRARAVVQACLEGSLQNLAKELRRTLVNRYAATHPLRALWCVAQDSARTLGRWMRPTGLCVILLGPDGVGKSTLIAGLNEAFGPVFERQRLFHWRPGLALPIRDGDDSLDSPHAQAARGPVASVCYLFGFFVDFCLGYAVHVRPMLARSGLIIFDRYFPDLMVDRLRYRYSGPAWLVRVLWAMLPKSDDLALILTADEGAILARKQQLPAEELRRQLKAYRGLREVVANAHVVDTGAGIGPTLAAGSQIVVEHLARRFQQRHRFTQPSGSVCLPESRV